MLRNRPRHQGISIPGDLNKKRAVYLEQTGGGFILRMRVFFRAFRARGNFRIFARNGTGFSGWNPAQEPTNRF
ncbi:MAG: hypothetical protein CMH76_06160 [Nitrospinae bacterium]|nr:hypothetical protein [Nitrospinota bacterium]